MVWKRAVDGALRPVSARPERARPSYLTPGPPSPRLSPSQSRLVERSIRLASELARRWALRWPRWSEEFESEALFALVEACRRVNSAAAEVEGDLEAVRIASYLNRRIRWALCDLTRERMGRRRKARVVPLSEMDLRELERQGRAGSLNATHAPDPSQLAIQNERLGQALARLPPRQAEVFRRTQLSGESPGRVAESLGISVKAVIMLRDRGLRGLAHLLGDSPRPRRQNPAPDRCPGVAPRGGVPQPPLNIKPAAAGLSHRNRGPTEAA